MGICVSLICFFVCTQAIIKSSKETCTAYTFQEKNQMEGEYRNVSDNYNIAVSCVHHYQFHP